MVTLMFEQIMKETKKHPFTMVAIVSLCALSWVGFTTFASAEEVAKVENKIDRVLEIQLAERIRDLQKEYCRANGNKSAIQRTIDDYQKEYRELAGERYPIQRCGNDT